MSEGNARDGDMTMGALVALIPNPGDTIRVGNMTVEMVGTFDYSDSWDVAATPEGQKDA